MCVFSELEMGDSNVGGGGSSSQSAEYDYLIKFLALGEHENFKTMLISWE